MTDAVAALYARLRGPTLGLAPSRRRFQQFYDDWLSDHTGSEDPANFIHAVWAASERCAALDPRPDPADSGDAMRLAVAMLGDGGRAFEVLAAATGAGLFDPRDGTDRTEFRKALSQKLRDTFAEQSVEAIRQSSSTREVLTHDDAFFTDPGNLYPAITFARRRLCRIEIRSFQGKLEQTGSGFLIGPSAVLTNLHVVDGVEEDLPDKTLRDIRIRIRFDYSETTGLKKDKASIFGVAPKWRLAAGGLGDASHTGPEDDPFWWDHPVKRQDWLDLVDDTLDYAVVALDGAPGLQRGWYTLSTQAGFAPAGAWALHHPGGMDHTITGGPIPIVTDDDGSRIFHMASTASGSSGGLVLDQDGKPIGLHYLGLAALDANRKLVKPDPQDPFQVNPAVNVAIALPHIARALKAKGLLEEIARVPGLHPHRGCIHGDRPVFGRADFLARLHQLWTGEKRILRVDLPDGVALNRPGKSFSAEIVADLFRGPENHHILFRAGEIAEDGHGVAKSALATFAEDLVDQMPDEPDTTSPAYVRRLVGFFATALRERLPNHNVWVVLDDLDRHDLSDASGREFLATLYNQINLLPQLRIVLIGLPRSVAISGMKDEDVLHSTLGSEDIENLRELFIAWLKERGGRDVPIADDGYRLLADIAGSVAATGAPLEQLAAFVTRHVAAAANSAFGPAAEGGS